MYSILLYFFTGKKNNIIQIIFIVFTYVTFTGPALWHLISGLMGGVKNIALYGKIKNDVFRTPTVQIVYGEENWVKFIDNGIM